MPTVSYASGRTLYLATKLTPAGTLTVTTDPGPTNGRLYGANDNQVEWIEYTSVTASGDNFILGGLTRDLDPVAIPATSNSTGKTWLATQKFVLVAMHDQLWDRQQGGPFASKTTAQLSARTNKQVGETFFDSTIGSLVYWTGSAYQSFGTGTLVNATTTSVGGIELPTDAEVIAGTDTGSVGPLAVQPSQHAETIQSGTFVYTTSSDVSDTYTGGLTPALTAYTTGQKVRVKFTTANTGACTLNLDSLGAKSIKLIDGTDPLDGDIAAGGTYDFIYDGTNMVLQSVAVRASSAEALTGTNTVKFMTPSTTKDSIEDGIGIVTTGLSFGTNYQASTSGFVSGYTNRNGGTVFVTGYVGAANPAATLILKSGSDAAETFGSFCFPVKKGYYWRADVSISPDESALTFTPNA